MKSVIVILSILVLGACKQATKQTRYTAQLHINDSLSIPFTLIYHPITNTYSVMNGDEHISNLIHTIYSDSINLEHPVFNSVLRFKKDKNTLAGFWYNLEKGNYKMPLTAIISDERFNRDASDINVSGKWSAHFVDQSNQYPAVGDFTQENLNVTGTFLTPTGDYRFLEGIVRHDSLFVSTFDFAHAFLFAAKFKENKLAGKFYSGNHSIEEWKAIKDPHAALTDAMSLVTIKDSVSYDFSIRSFSGEKIDLNHPLFTNKAIVIQLFGSWCPNCYDESIFLNSLYANLPKDKIEFVGVAFERSENISQAKIKIDKFRKSLGIRYPLTYGGPHFKDSAQQHFPFIEKVIAFPSLIFYDSEHNIRGIHSGFNGPGSGTQHQTTKRDIEQAIRSLIAE